jgi:hypothetical protein
MSIITPYQEVPQGPLIPGSLTLNSYESSISSLISSSNNLKSLHTSHGPLDKYLVL